VEKMKKEKNEEVYLKAFKDLCSPDPCTVPDEMIVDALLGPESHWTSSFIEKVKGFAKDRPDLLKKINERISKTV
jgi:hypothetical protein